MAAGDESFGPGTGPDEPGRCDGPRAPGPDDPLMAVLLGEPLPATAREDPALVAAHRAALADAALLREQLGLIGDALADAETDTETDALPRAEPGAGSGARAGVVDGARPGVAGGAVVRPFAPARPRPRWRAVALGGLAVACAAAFLSGAAWLLTQSGGTGGGAQDSAAGSKGAAGSGFGSPRSLACARLVVEGTVTSAVPAPGSDARRVTLHVTRAYRPEGEEGRTEPVVFLVPDGVAVRRGEHALVGLPRPGAYPDALVTGEAEVAAGRERLLRALPDAHGRACPRT